MVHIRNLGLIKNTQRCLDTAEAIPIMFKRVLRYVGDGEGEAAEGRLVSRVWRSDKFGESAGDHGASPQFAEQ